MMDVRGKRVLVVGLGKSGHAAALCLRRHGAVVTVSDTKPPDELSQLLPDLVAEKVGLELGFHRLETFLASELVVVSPGVPWDLSQLKLARERGIPVVPEVELAGWYLRGPVVGVTGSNGKTTTTALLGKMLEASGFPTFVGGNIGVPLSSAVDRVSETSIIIAELSSFQLEAIQDFHPRVAVLLNVSPNHLDRHPSLEAYTRAKRQIFRNQQAEDYAILNADDPWVRGLSPALASRKVFFSRTQQVPCGVFVSDGKIVYRTQHLERMLLERRDVRLRGAFNLENVLAAAAAACVLGADLDALRSAVREFEGVEHRLEYVRDIRGVAFYNNSKATSVDATVKSLEAFEPGVHLILGGKDKGAPYEPLRPLLQERVREAFLIGAAADRLASELAGATELIHSGNLEAAVTAAFRRARPGDVVLLAPACSSYDQFQDFEQRGRVFKELVGRLARDIESESVERTGKPEGQVRTGSPTSFPSPTTPPPVSEAEPRAGTAEPLREKTSGTQQVIEEAAPAGPEVTGQAEPEVPAGSWAIAPAQGSRPGEPPLAWEISAEDFPVGKIEPAPNDETEPELQQRQAPRALERPEDELMPFEARADEQGAAAVASTDSDLRNEGATDETKAPEQSPTRTKSAEPESTLPDSGSQPRLPGMD
jgi:UDP-N-acetylmuramoylalanine--D-glutamate ligase